MHTTDIIIQAKDIGFSYNGIPVLENVTFAIEKGDYVGIIGPNGGGKSTLIKILVGILSPKSGEVQVHGTIGYVPQHAADGSMTFPATVYEIVRSGRTPKKNVFQRLQSDDHTAIQKAIDISSIRHLQNRRLSDLSGGERQRVAVARALASEPDILILDEPFVGIDIAAQNDFYAFLQKINKEQKLTILFVSHDIDAITEEIHSILCLNRGLMCFGDPTMLHEGDTLDTLYGRKITHIHHHSH